MLWGVKELLRPAMRESFRFSKLIDGRMGYHLKEGPLGFVSLRSADSPTVRRESHRRAGVIARCSCPRDRYPALDAVFPSWSECRSGWPPPRSWPSRQTITRTSRRSCRRIARSVTGPVRSRRSRSSTMRGAEACPGYRRGDRGARDAPLACLDDRGRPVSRCVC